jgi:aromatic-L-amino-acid decarboxylase
MDPEVFRKEAHEIVDWIADYVKNVREHPVVPEVKPGEIRKRFPGTPPEAGEDFGAVFEDFRKIVVPGMTHWNHPGWFAYFPANNSLPSIEAEMLTAALGAQCMSWITSPAATELEQVVMDWVRSMIGLPDGFTGVIQDTASTATLVALLSARERATKYAFSRYGGRAEGGDRLTVYASTEAHSSVEKGVRLSGIGVSRYRRIPVDSNYAMIPEALEEAVKEDIETGLVPCCTVGVTGTTSSSGIDPLGPIGEICKEHGIWLHVDGAYAGTAAILPECRYILDGIDKADSFVFNPHKWMFTNFDCSAYFVKDVDALLRTFSMTPEYLKSAYDSSVVNFRDWGIQLGRRFRALKLWFVIRRFGLNGLREKVRDHISLAREFCARVKAHPDFELLAPAPLGLVCFRHRPKGRDSDDPTIDGLNEKLLADVNASGKVHLTHTRLSGKFAIRLSVGQLYTTREDVETAWSLFTQKAEEMHAPPPSAPVKPKLPG